MSIKATLCFSRGWPFVHRFDCITEIFDAVIGDKNKIIQIHLNTLQPDVLVIKGF